MVRSLPESTVDAWTAVSLAQQGAETIWLPTTNAGASTGGSHPGDVSAVSSDRLLVLENKGIESLHQIDFGKKHQRQSLQLANLQTFGQWLVCDPTWLGWVFYGVPMRSGPSNRIPWNGGHFRQFPKSQRMLCPHEARRLRGRTQGLSVIRAQAMMCNECHDVDTVNPPTQPLTLAHVGGLALAGRVGLPFDHLSSHATSFLDFVIDERSLISFEFLEFHAEGIDFSDQQPPTGLAGLAAVIQSVLDRIDDAATDDQSESDDRSTGLVFAAF